MQYNIKTMWFDGVPIGLDYSEEKKWESIKL